MIPALKNHQYELAVVILLINRFCDGLDGALARFKESTDAGGFLDITLDFLFYSAVVFGFALADPATNALAAVFLIFSFIGTGSSFLAFAVMAAKQKIESIHFPQKSLYYLGGLTEGTETILFYLSMCLFPQAFVWLAYLFGTLCWITTITRIIGGYFTLRRPLKK